MILEKKTEHILCLGHCQKTQKLRKTKLTKLSGIMTLINVRIFRVYSSTTIMNCLLFLIWVTNYLYSVFFFPELCLWHEQHGRKMRFKSHWLFAWSSAKHEHDIAKTSDFFPPDFSPPHLPGEWACLPPLLWFQLWEECHCPDSASQLRFHCGARTKQHLLEGLCIWEKCDLQVT